ncbi:MAG: V-type ATP synthase subunit E [Parachlamydiaceae bacterium]|nr:V-type ATP synthase subunit E [Parachlamydiaceae bacterium]
MRTLEKGQEKIKKICSILREETLEPAKKQAEEILDEARKQAETIIAEAQKNAKSVVVDTKAEMDQERNVFNSSLQQAVKQSLESLRQEIENNFFNNQLHHLIEKECSNPNLTANLINAIINALEKDGISADLSALVPKTISPHDVNVLLMKNVLNSLKENSVAVGKFAAGAQVRINNKKVTIDITEDALKDLLSNYVVRKDFRKMIFTV